MMSDEREARINKIRDTISGNFTRGAKSYAAFEEENSFFKGLLKKLLSLSPPPVGGRVLDVGCGTGASLEGLAEAVGVGGEVVGLDISAGMLEEAKQRYGDKYNLICADGCDFDANKMGGQFDAVVYNAVLFMLPDARASLSCAKAALKPGGAIYIASLEGVEVDGAPLPDLLSKEGLKAGRHALSPWSKVAPLLEEFFNGTITSEFTVNLTPKLFRGFYTLEPMSAGLLPTLPYPERKRTIEEYANRFADEGVVPVQRWVLSASKQ
ncbi:MAG: hypothetical protein C0608_02775 [Deltaproteobacteria bacterium]|nr:MAG: hypothetical protein C0608_02775 [Deltaproteobacteria bacterium]